MSKLLRRSGVAVCTMCDVLNWEPTLIVQVGVGFNYRECEVFQEIWPDAGILGIEAHPNVYNGIVDDYPGSLVHGAAVRPATHAKHATVPLHFRKRHKDGSSLFQPKEGAYETTEVPTVTVDEIVGKFAPSYQSAEILLWLDCEGAEYGALHGATRTMAATKVINVELNSKERRAGAPSAADTHKLLNEFQFWRTRVHTNRTSAGQYDAIYVRRCLYQSQFSCCPCQDEEEQT